MDTAGPMDTKSKKATPVQYADKQSMAINVMQPGAMGGHVGEQALGHLLMGCTS